MYLLNNTKIDINRPFTGPDGKKYPHLRPQEYRDELGVVEVPDPVYPDSRTHTWTENPDGTLNITERPLADIKASRLSEIRSQARAIIEAKYPQFVRENIADGTYPDPDGSMRARLVADKEAVVVASNTAEDAVDAALTSEEVLAVTPIWPVI